MVRRPATQARFEGIRFTHRDPAPPASQFPPSPAGRAEVAPRRGARNGLGRLQLIKGFPPIHANRSEEHTSELQSLMRISYAVFCLKKKKSEQTQLRIHHTTEYHISHKPPQHKTDT